MRRLLLAAILCLPAAARAEPTLTIIPLGFEVREFRGPQSRVAATAASIAAFRDDRAEFKTLPVIVWGQEGAAALTLAQGAVKVVRARRSIGDLPGLERGPNMLAASRIGGFGMLAAMLEQPTRDYAHEALGSALHASSVSITERKPAPPSSEPKPVVQEVVHVAAGQGAVFEDREPHVVEIGGQPAILVVRSYRDRGSALVLLGKRDGAWKAVGETPADGEPFRWLNPVTSGERGQALARDIALVRRPHLDGLLQLWRLEGDKLTLRTEKAGYSNHAYGSTAQDLAVWFAAEGDAARLAIPSLDRQALAILAIDREIREIARIPLPAKALTGVAALGRGRDLHLLVGLEDGRIADIRP